MVTPPLYTTSPRTIQWAANLNAPGYVGQFSGHRREETCNTFGRRACHRHLPPAVSPRLGPLSASPTAKICHTSYGHAPVLRATPHLHPHTHTPTLPTIVCLPSGTKALYMRHCQLVKCERESPTFVCHICPKGPLFFLFFFSSSFFFFGHKTKGSRCDPSQEVRN